MVLKINYKDKKAEVTCTQEEATYVAQRIRELTGEPMNEWLVNVTILTSYSSTGTPYIPYIPIAPYWDKRWWEIHNLSGTTADPSMLGIRITTTGTAPVGAAVSTSDQHNINYSTE